MGRKYGNRFVDLTGKRYGRLVVVKRATPVGEKVKWECKCDCGNTTIIPTSYLTTGDTRSCGCLFKELDNEINLREKFKEKYIEDVNTSSLKRKTNKNNTSGIKGVSWNKQKSKWVASIALKGKTKYLGAYATKKEAVKARKQAENKYHKPYLDQLEDNKNENK